jgi:hypothetical protein
MSTVFKINIQDNASPALRGLAERLTNRRGLNTVLGKGLEVALRGHFASRERERNKKNWPKQHFWSQIRTATAFDPGSVTDDGAAVVVADPRFGAKVHGAQNVTAKPPNKRLAIPLRAEAYGVRPRSGLIPGLFVLKARGRAWLAAREGKALRLYYLLLPSVNLPPDPRALPDGGRVAGELQGAAMRYLLRG